MSLFARTSADVESVEKMAMELAESSAPAPDRKASLDNLVSSMASIRVAVDKFVTNANAGEADPNRRLYGATMVSKIRALEVRVDKLADTVAGIEETVNSAMEAYLATKVAAEKEKFELEQKQKQAERLQALREKELQSQKEELERAERERRAHEEKEAAKKLADIKKEEERRQEELRILAAKREKEESENRMAADAAAAVAVADQARAEDDRQNNEKIETSFSLTVKTSKGAALSFPDISGNATVLSLKQQVEKMYGIQVAAQRLIFQGRLLDNERKLADYKIGEGVVVHLVENSKAAMASSSSSPAPKPLVTPGTLCHLANGKAEFEAILASCGNNRLAIFDFSAPWCGPCRMIAPVYERLASRFADVTFVKVDTEQSAPNAQLSQELGIRAYPTFQYYVASVKVHEFSGANASQIEAGIRSHKPIPAVGSASNGGPSSSHTATNLSSQLMTALNNLKRSCSNEDFIVAVRTLLTFVRNIVDHPHDPKYRRVRTANTAYQTRIARHGAHGLACMHAFGFESKSENGEDYLVISESAANNPELGTVKAQLETAMQAAGITVDSSAGAAPGMDAPAGRAADPFTGTGDMFMGAGMQGLNPRMPPADHELMEQLMADPTFVQMAQEVAANPEYLALAMRMQTAMQTGDRATLIQLASDPAMQRVQQLLYSNPVMLQRMTEQMHAGGGNGPQLAQLMAMMGGQGRGNHGTPGAAAAAGPGPGFLTPTQARTTLDPPGAPRHGPSPDPPLPANVAWPGAPTTEEEEEMLLQEAIRLSMEESNKREYHDETKKDPPAEGDGNGGSA